MAAAGSRRPFPFRLDGVLPPFIVERLRDVVPFRVLFAGIGAPCKSLAVSSRCPDACCTFRSHMLSAALAVPKPLHPYDALSPPVAEPQAGILRECRLPSASSAHLRRVQL